MDPNRTADVDAGTGEEGEVNAIDLPAFLDLGYARELKQLLQDAMQKGGHLAVNGAAVESITSPCIQVLLAADRSLSEFGSRLELVTPSEVLTSAFDDLGLNRNQGWSNIQ